MPAEELVLAWLNELRGPDDWGTARDMAEANGVTLLPACGVGSALVTGMVDKEDGDRERSLGSVQGADRGSPGTRNAPVGSAVSSRRRRRCRPRPRQYTYSVGSADRSADGRWQIGCRPSHQAHTTEARKGKD